MVSKGGVPKGRIIPVYLTDEGDVYIENLEAELNECKMLNNQLMSDLDADEGLAEICVNEFIADTIKAVKDAGVKKITVEF